MRIQDRHETESLEREYDQETYEDARKHVATLRSFYTHGLVYLVVNSVLVTKNVLEGPPWWCLMTLFGWGIGLAFHAAHAYGVGVFGRNWEARQIQRVLDDRSRHAGQ